MTEITYEKYISFAKNIISNNDFQRKKVRSSNTTYSLLKSDMKEGCILPPIVLALDERYLTNSDLGNTENHTIENILNEHLEELIILDGLQRTYTLLDALAELQDQTHVDKTQLDLFLKSVLRLELYVGVNRFGTLYRMLTLNTGQTPMSLRHQIEILYNDLDLSPKNILLLKETSEKTPTEPGEYAFKDVIDGFNSYIESDYLPMTRSSVLNTIKSIESLTKENTRSDVFEDFIVVYNELQKYISSITPKEDIQLYLESLENGEDILNVDEQVSIENSSNIKSLLYADNIFSLFKKSQTLTGFGGGMGKLRDLSIITSISSIRSIFKKIIPGGTSSYEWLSQLNLELYKIKITSKKIGNSQRYFFYFFFRSLFSDSSDSYLNLLESVKNAAQKYRAES